MSNMKWKTVKIGDVADICLGKMLDQEKNQGNYMPYLANINVRWGEFDLLNLRRMRFESDELEKFSLKYGDIIMCEGGEPGRCAIWKQHNSNILFQKALHRIRTHECLDSNYLYYVLLLMGKHNSFDPFLTGSTIKHLPSIKLAIIDIPLPPLPIQRKIAAVLTALDDKIALNKRINDKLEAMVKRLYDYWFVQFDFPDENGRPYKSSGGKMVWNEMLKREIPAGWEVKNVKNVIKPIQRGISYSSEDIGSSEGISLINLGCYSKQGDYRTGELKTYSGNYSFEDLVFPFDMLIACTDMTQNCDIIGRPIFVHKENAFYLYTMDLAKLSPNDGTRMYLYYTLRTNFYHRYIKPFASGTNVKHLNVAGIENYSICIPDDNTKYRFEDMITTIKEKQMDSINEASRLTALRDRLLPLLMNGQVVVEGEE